MTPGAGSSAPFQLALPGFQGSVWDLVRQVTERRVAAEELNVTEIARQFSAYLDQARVMNLDEAGEFLSAATRLLCIKSAHLLFEPEREEDEGQVLARLPRWMGHDQFQTLVAALRDREGVESVAPMALPDLVARRIEPRQPGSLTRAWEYMSARRGKRSASLSVPGFVRLEAAVSLLIRKLRAGVSVSFRALAHGATRDEAVIHFLAVLELIRRRQAVAGQDDLFGDITVEYVESAAQSASRAG
ncbi:MAG: segregation and condensation protein A [Chloroflexota bacterium]